MKLFTVQISFTGMHADLESWILLVCTAVDRLNYEGHYFLMKTQVNPVHRLLPVFFKVLLIWRDKYISYFKFWNLSLKISGHCQTSETVWGGAVHRMNSNFKQLFVVWLFNLITDISCQVTNEWFCFYFVPLRVQACVSVQRLHRAAAQLRLPAHWAGYHHQSSGKCELTHMWFVHRHICICISCFHYWNEGNSSKNTQIRFVNRVLGK